jgi:hypothetical protein
LLQEQQQTAEVPSKITFSKSKNIKTPLRGSYEVKRVTLNNIAHIGGPFPCPLTNLGCLSFNHSNYKRNKKNRCIFTKLLFFF